MEMLMAVLQRLLLVVFVIGVAMLFFGCSLAGYFKIGIDPFFIFFGALALTFGPMLAILVMAADEGQRENNDRSQPPPVESKS
jgi:hypothetical protein